jgi:hypothetical protein
MREVVRVTSLEADGGAARSARARATRSISSDASMAVTCAPARRGPSAARRAGADVDGVPAVERSAELRQDAPCVSASSSADSAR